MAFQVASIQNIRKQRQLELELVDLDKRWHVELKVLARERLGLLKDLCRINREMRAAEHFRAGVHGRALVRFTDRAQVRLQQERQTKSFTHKYDFEPDQMVERINFQLPFIAEEAAAEHGYLDGGGGERGGDGGKEDDDGGFDIDPKLLTSKELNKQRVLMQKITLEHSLQDKRSRRRAFWDKSIIDTRRKKNLPQPDKHGLVRIPPPGAAQGGGPAAGPGPGGRGAGAKAGGTGAVFNGAFGQRKEPAHPDGTSTQLPPPQPQPPPQPHPPLHHQQQNGNESNSKERTSRDEDPAKRGSSSDGDAVAAGDVQNPRRPYGPMKYPSLPALNNLRRVDTIRVRGKRRMHPSLSNRNSASMDYLPVIKGTRGQLGMFTSPSTHQLDPHPPTSQPQQQQDQQQQQQQQQEQQQQQQQQEHLPSIVPVVGLPTITEA